MSKKLKLLNSILVAGMAAAVLGSCDPTPTYDLAVGYIADVDVFGELERFPVQFDHDRHTKGLDGDKSCASCHHEYDKAAGRLVYVKGKEKACKECHGLTREDDRPDLMDAYHDRCMKCHEERSTDGLNAGPENCNGCHEAQTFPEWVAPVTFEHSSHMRVMDTGKSCDNCHHVWDEKTQKTHYAKGEEAACDKCHGEPLQNHAKTDLRVVTHTKCLGCHRGEVEAGRKAGPTTCAGCHDPVNYPRKAEKHASDQLRFEKVDLVLIDRPEAILPGVPFNHKVHQEKTPDCIVCHTAHVFAMAGYTEHMDAVGSKCSLCHTAASSAIPEEARARLGSGVSPEAAYHDDKAPSSCIGCHTARDTKGPKSLKPCTACHQGEQGMKVLEEKGELLTTPNEENWPEKGPEVYLIERLADRFAPVQYPHAKHQEMVVACETCHHYVKPEMKRTPPCYTCHGPIFDPKEPDKPGLVGSYHQMCLGCHRNMGMGPVACEKCHQKKS